MSNSQVNEKANAKADGAKGEEKVVSGDLPMTPDTVALEQKGKVSPISPTSDKSIDEATDAFDSAVNSALAFVNIASVVKNRTTPTTPAPDVYYLSERMKELLRKRASEFASFGVVPYDVLEEFLFVLVSIDNLNDMKIIGDVVGIPELGDIAMVRNPEKILNIRDLYKIGYIANGLASITKRFSQKFQNVQNVSDSTLSKYSGLLTPDSSGNLSFSSLKDVISLGQTLSSTVSNISGITSTFGTGGVPDFSTQISNLPNVISNVVESATGLESILKNLMSDNINQLLPTMRKITDTVAQAKHLKKLSENLVAVTLANDTPLVGDVQLQLSKISTKVTEVQNKLTEVMTEIANAKPPEGAGAISQDLDKRDPGRFLGNFLSSIVMGQAIPSSLAANNPLLQSPSYVGKAFFGESGVSLPAIDQLFNKRIAAFSEVVQAAGTNSFSLQNFASFSGVMDLNSVVSKMILNKNTTTPMITNTVTNVANLLNVPVDASIEMRRSDNAIPLMIALSSALVNDTYSPYPSGVFASAFKLASATANEVQKLDPKFLEAARTSL